MERQRLCLLSFHPVDPVHPVEFSSLSLCQAAYSARRLAPCAARIYLAALAARCGDLRRQRELATISVRFASTVRPLVRFASRANSVGVNSGPRTSRSPPPRASRSRIPQRTARSPPPPAARSAPSARQFPMQAQKAATSRWCRSEPARAGRWRDIECRKCRRAITDDRHTERLQEFERFGISRTLFAPAQTTATGVRLSSSKSAEMSKECSAPR